ncbi:MAG: MlaE family lipid ABC transporter permease subunit [Alphaproteobacteria bacterium]|nr:MlaE family lipid ABC transporter permease subunit [Alphaproteobacteria bacterium]
MAALQDSSRDSGTAEPLRVSRDGDAWVLSIVGALDVSTIGRLDGRIRRLDPGEARAVRIDLSQVDSLDTAGAWVVQRLTHRLESGGRAVSIVGAKPTQAALIERVGRTEDRETVIAPKSHPLLAVVQQTGEQTFARISDAKKITAFFGLVAITLVRSLAMPWRIRYVSLVHHMQQAGLNAIPITTLLSVLIGVVLAYQGAFQLQRFGAEIFTVNLIGISVLREIGVLMTSIVIAGRSGSAFTAQIGTMKVNQEVDAMITIGLDPAEVLVLPRVLAMMFTLPMLVFLADIMGLFGGGVMCLLVLDITPTQYLNQLHGAIGPWTFWVGIIKAPVFAFVIAMVGCYEGMQVSGSAESVGKLTTKSVVESIFLVILLDAMFSVLFANLGI